jgi:hypothetical protein
LLPGTGGESYSLHCPPGSAIESVTGLCGTDNPVCVAFIYKIVPVPCCPTFHMLQHCGGPSHHNLIPGILLDTLQACSMLPHFT